MWIEGIQRISHNLDGEELVAKHESHNVCDRYTIAAFKLLPGTINP